MPALRMVGARLVFGTYARRPEKCFVLYLEAENDLSLRRCPYNSVESHYSALAFPHLLPSPCPSIPPSTQHLLSIYCAPKLITVVTKMAKAVPV